MFTHSHMTSLSPVAKFASDKEGAVQVIFTPEVVNACDDPVTDPRLVYAPAEDRLKNWSVGVTVGVAVEAKSPKVGVQVPAAMLCPSSVVTSHIQPAKLASVGAGMLPTPDCAVVVPRAKSCTLVVVVPTFVDLLLLVPPEVLLSVPAPVRVVPATLVP